MGRPAITTGPRGARGGGRPGGWVTGTDPEDLARAIDEAAASDAARRRTWRGRERAPQAEFSLDASISRCWRSTTRPSRGGRAEPPTGPLASRGSGTRPTPGTRLGERREDIRTASLRAGARCRGRRHGRGPRAGSGLHVPRPTWLTGYTGLLVVLDATAMGGRHADRQDLVARHQPRVVPHPLLQHPLRRLALRPCPRGSCCWRWPAPTTSARSATAPGLDPGRPGRRPAAGRRRRRVLHPPPRDARAGRARRARPARGGPHPRCPRRARARARRAPAAGAGAADGPGGRDAARRRRGSCTRSTPGPTSGVAVVGLSVIGDRPPPVARRHRRTGTAPATARNGNGTDVTRRQRGGAPPGRPRPTRRGRPRPARPLVRCARPVPGPRR